MSKPRPPKRSLRTAEQRIADLRVEIARIEAKQAARTDPARPHVESAVRELDRALETARDPATRDALGVARTTLLACLMMETSPPQVRAALRGVEREDGARWIAEHPGRTSAEIAEAMDDDVDVVRGLATRLGMDERLRAEGLAQ